MGSGYSALHDPQEQPTWLQAQGDFSTLLDAEWRSERTRELDKLGGDLAAGIAGIWAYGMGEGRVQCSSAQHA